MAITCLPPRNIVPIVRSANAGIDQEKAEYSLFDAQVAGRPPGKYKFTRWSDKPLQPRFISLIRASDSWSDRNRRKKKCFKSSLKFLYHTQF